MLAKPLHSDRAGVSPEPQEHALHRIFALDLERVEVEVRNGAKSNVSKVSSITEYVVSAGGKRIRPLLTLASAALCGEVKAATYKLATAVEYIHTATLLHDDVLDDSDMRRGRLASRKVWGNTNSVLVGDFLFARAFELMVETGSMDVLAILSKSASIIVEGEIRQLDAIMSERPVSREDYYATIDAKTAELFRAACVTGAMSGGCQAKQKLDAMAQYGLNLGRAFQIVDDVLDYVGKTEDIGKHTGDDFREQKLTLPLILAAEHCDAHTVAEIFSAMRQNSLEIDAFAAVRGTLQKHGIFDLARSEANAFVDKAIDALDLFKDESLADELILLAQQGLTRLN